MRKASEDIDSCASVLFAHRAVQNHVIVSVLGRDLNNQAAEGNVGHREADWL